MNGFYHRRTGVSPLRPWPFGPPLRGRAPQRDAGTLSTPVIWRSEASGMAPVGSQGEASPNNMG